MIDLSFVVGLAKAFVSTTGVGAPAVNLLELGIDLATFIPKFREIIAASPDATPEVLAEATALADRMEEGFDADLADLGRRAPNS